MSGGTGTERLRKGVAPAEDRSETIDRTRLVLYAAALRRPGDLLETMLERQRAYNKIVAEVIHEAGSPSAKIMKYVGDGVLTSFAPDGVTEALRCAGRIADRLDALPEPPGGGEIESRMGLSAGEVMDENYLNGSAPEMPIDFVGQPIEIATRLVSDVAKSRQILLDHAARDHIENKHLKELDPLMPQAELRPVKGESLMIDGVRTLIPVFELIWQGQEERKIHNRQLLRRELQEIRQATLLLRFEIENNYPAFANDLVEASKKVQGLLQKLDPRRRSSEIAQVKSSVDGSTEAQKVVGLVETMRATKAAFDQLKTAWKQNETAVAVGFDAKAAVKPVEDACQALLFKARELDYEVDIALQALDEDA